MVFTKGHKPYGTASGKKTKKTILKEKALEQLQQDILRDLKELYLAGRKSATGLMVMYQRKKVKNKKTGKWERTGELVRVSDPNRIEELLRGPGEGEDWYYISAKDPNIQAFNSLLDRTFGKPKESIELGGEDGGPINLEIGITKAIEKTYGSNRATNNNS